MALVGMNHPYQIGCWCETCSIKRKEIEEYWNKRLGRAFDAVGDAFMKPVADYLSVHAAVWRSWG